MPGRSAPLARLSRQIGPPALEGFKNKGLIRLDDSAQRSRLVASAGARRNRCRQRKAVVRMHAAQFSGLHQTLALDHRPGVIEPTLLLAQMRHRRFGQRVERAPATLAAEPQKTVRTAPSRSPRGRRNADNPGFPPAQRSSFQARPPPPAALAALARRSFFSRSVSLLVHSRERPHGFPAAAPRSYPQSPDNQPEKSSARIESSPRPIPPTIPTDNAIRALFQALIALSVGRGRFR